YLKQNMLMQNIQATIALITGPSLWGFDSVGLQLARGILSDSELMGHPANVAVKVVGILNGIWEIGTVCRNLRNNLTERLEQYDAQHLGMASLIKMSTAINIPDANHARLPNVNAILRVMDGFVQT